MVISVGGAQRRVLRGYSIAISPPLIWEGMTPKCYLRMDIISQITLNVNEKGSYHLIFTVYYKLRKGAPSQFILCVSEKGALKVLTLIFVPCVSIVQVLLFIFPKQKAYEIYNPKGHYPPSRINTSWFIDALAKFLKTHCMILSSVEFSRKHIK